MWGSYCLSVYFCCCYQPDAVMRLDRLVGKWGGLGKRRVREVLEAGKVRVNGASVSDGTCEVGFFDRVEVGDEILQARVARYVMLHKPAGVVSATVDDEHKTVIDLIDEDWAGELHLAGRLDRFTTGLLILTNDSRFSESLTDRERKVGKRYLVEADSEISVEAAEAFRNGMWFSKERTASAPAELEVLGPRQCRITIYEGMHHQVKRMFAHFGIKVIALHREAVGEIELPEDLLPGQWREIE